MTVNSKICFSAMVMIVLLNISSFNVQTGWTQSTNQLPDPENAKLILRVVSNAAEKYAVKTNGFYNKTESELDYSSREPLNQYFTFSPEFPMGPYCNQTYYGYHFECSFSEGQYTVMAQPIPESNTAGALKTFRVITGGVLEE